MPGDGRLNGTEPRNAQNMYEYMDGFEPSQLEDEKGSGGWIRTTMPVGSDILNVLITAGTVYSEKDTAPTVGRPRTAAQGPPKRIADDLYSGNVKPQGPPKRGYPEEHSDNYGA